jgi:hypothetical protein
MYFISILLFSLFLQKHFGLLSTYCYISFYLILLFFFCGLWFILLDGGLRRQEKSKTIKFIFNDGLIISFYLEQKHCEELRIIRYIFFILSLQVSGRPRHAKNLNFFFDDGCMQINNRTSILLNFFLVK